ncbi:MAG: type II toxin-antitoxin system PemK/MazF family toxin [Bacteroidetes bacterium]|nr:type II toxin-antitoxin system PemK/MazF family toxin [Bacteroidota bacterium]
MSTEEKGISLLPFPFSDLTQAKRRPALFISVLEGDDMIFCQITSKATSDHYAILLENEDFEMGGLKQPINVRPNRIFTADSHIVLYKVGQLKVNKLNSIIEKVIEIIRR